MQTNCMKQIENNAHSDKDATQQLGARTFYHCEHQRWETFLFLNPTKLRLPRAFARMTRTRNGTSADFPIGGLLRRSFLPVSDIIASSKDNMSRRNIDHTRNVPMNYYRRRMEETRR